MFDTTQSLSMRDSSGSIGPPLECALILSAESAAPRAAAQRARRHTRELARRTMTPGISTLSVVSSSSSASSKWMHACRRSITMPRRQCLATAASLHLTAASRLIAAHAPYPRAQSAGNTVLISAATEPDGSRGQLSMACWSACSLSILDTRDSRRPRVTALMDTSES